ncbi:MAG TPA: response regulator transcription factor [Ramlibacter sp.]|jgi:hypothetical protein|nr:response regulator transcription factor [Ramlibacter sp.]
MQRNLLSVLVVDDDPTARYAMARALRAAGFKTMEAASGAEALEFAEYVSAVILDIHLPDLLGWEVCRLIRQKPGTSHLPVVHVSSRYVTDEDREKSRASGADGYFTAPVDCEALVAHLDALLSSSPGEAAA